MRFWVWYVCLHSIMFVDYSEVCGRIPLKMDT